MTLLSNSAAVLLAVAAAITPLGLHTVIGLSNPKEMHFEYAKDTSMFGRATQSRSGYKSNRLCGFEVAQNCPGNYNGWNFSTYSNGTLHAHSDPGDKSPFVSTAIAPNITDVFTSATKFGTVASTVANFFDIEFRSFYNFSNNRTQPGPDEKAIWVDEGRPHTQGQFHYYQQFLLNGKTEAVEGLIVSTSDSTGQIGIGFRNHTLPPSSQHGYLWEEEILWLEPETVCTNLNITLDYTVPDPFAIIPSYPSGRITDRGGLANNPKKLSKLNLTATQENPRLLEKSWAGAILTNAILRRFLNATDADLHVGKEYPLSTINRNCGDLWVPKPNELAIGPYGYANEQAQFYNPRLPGSLFECNPIGSPSNDSLYISDFINDYTLGDVQRSQIATSAGIIQGVGFMVDSKGNPIPDVNGDRLSPGLWSQPFHSCASGLKASVKTIRFELKDTAALSNLIIRDVHQSNVTQPIWANENTGWLLGEVNPIWGLISEENAASPGISALRNPTFYLPAGSSLDMYGAMNARDAVAGADAPISGLSTIYSGQIYEQFRFTLESIPDYSGSLSWPLLLKWSDLGRDSSTVGTIVDLIWTDIMANALVGTRSGLEHSTAESGDRSVAPFVSTVSYDWRYAALALIFAAMYLVLSVWSLISYAAKSCDISTLRYILNQSSAGRSVTTERYRGDKQARNFKTKDWAHARGDELVLASKDDVKRTYSATDSGKGEESDEAQEAYDTHDAHEASEAQEANRML